MKKNLPSKPMWHSLDLPAVFRALRADKTGLSDKQAQERLAVYGRNSLPQAKKTASITILLNQLKSPLVYVLIFAFAVSVFLRELADLLVIGAVIVINTIFGWLEENKANEALAKLKQLVVYQAKVLRDGRQTLINTAELAPGDLVVLRSGDKVPADCRLVSLENFQASEALLTGESMAVTKKIKELPPATPLAERINMVYMGTAVVRGSALAIVVATGLETEMGKISRLLKETKEEKTPLQDQLANFSRLLTFIVAALCLFVILIGLLRGYGLIQLLLTASALAVAAIPEGLLIALTIILALGMQKILANHSLVKRLVAAETLGNVSIILSDKTGTLTEGKMQVARLITGDQEFFPSAREKLEGGALEKEHDLMLKVSMLCSSAQVENPDEALSNLRIIGDPTETALLIAGLEAGFDKDVLDREYPRLQEIPFDSEQKFMATLHQHSSADHFHVFAKGAPEKILAFCDHLYLSGQKRELTPAQRRKLLVEVENMAGKGLRVLALAYKTGDRFQDLAEELNHLIFIGLAAVKDPLRPEARSAIDECRRAGIRPIIITGDHPLTAKAIFEDLGLKETGRIITGAELDKLSDGELDRKLDKLDIYARTEPRHKLRLVKAWQARGEVVAMTGDGVNDAPAIKAADIGVALGSGSDVTKETADIILLDNNFKTIVGAVREGRIIFDNIRKVIFYLLTGSFSEIILILGSMLLGLPLPLTALQILWINLIDHGLPSFALTLERQEDDVMRYPPRHRAEPILNREIKIMIFAIGIITDIVLLAVFILMHRAGWEIDYIRTFIFATLSIDSLFCAFSIRSLRQTIFNKNIFSNKYLLLAVAVSLVLILPAFYPPFGQLIFKTVLLGPADWLIVVLLAIFKTGAIEISKYLLVIKKARSLRRSLA